MLVINRFVVAEDAADHFAERGRAALAALAARPGYTGGRLTRALDDPAHWSLVTEWESVGSYRRALSDFDVKIAAVPLMAESIDEPSAFEELATADPGGEVRVAGSDRAAHPHR
ncbi:MULTISPECIES: antibiotic biosynthesis monooxygenase family protein [Catenuloplanes]|uniref:Quinol monooxygenase YgiN n=1 Tax=Catenuloplanes niger TaxID=587534 RepID=A0AAE3ZME2_9ACTN|nr:antibiotic biosynthesis monooxygenase [Catenuloplanes niger]MDR7321961.1 quinol monooxygenase YgiN [Catenuloplanes niger]